MSDGTWVGLDVHARSVVAGLIDAETGECRTQSVPVAIEELVGWLSGLPGPVRVAHEAGPTGYGLARTLDAARISCVGVCALVD